MNFNFIKEDTMKRFTLSMAALAAMGTLAMAGGDIEAPVEPIVEVEAPMAVSDSGFYIGGAVSLINSETDANGAYGDGDEYDYQWSEESEGDTYGFMLQAGYQFNKYIAVEGRYWNANTEIDSTYTDDYGTYSSNDGYGDMTAWGIYVKPMYPVTDAVSIYGLLGYGNTQIEDKAYGGKQLLDENSFQWGVGASYAYDEHISFFVDYVQLASDAEESHDYNAGDEDPYWDYDYVNWETSVYAVNVGVSYKF